MSRLFLNLFYICVFVLSIIKTEVNKNRKKILFILKNLLLKGFLFVIVSNIKYAVTRQEFLINMIIWIVVMKFTYRQAREEECIEVAELVSIASAGVLDLLYKGLVPGKKPVELLAEFLRDADGCYSYRNTTIAETEGRLVGMAVSYDSVHHGINDSMRTFFPSGRLILLEDLFASRVEKSLYIDALAVHENYRGKGAARGLLDEAKQKAQNMDLGSLSLIAFNENSIALNLYRSFGFEKVKDIRFEGHELVRYSGNAALLVCEV